MDKSINDRVKEVRLALNMKQGPFRETIGIGQSGYSDLERKKNSVSFDVFRNIVRNHNVDANWLLGIPGYPMFRTENNSKGTNEELSKIEDLDQRLRSVEEKLDLI